MGIARLEDGDARPARAAIAVVVMGVSGCGKTVVGEGLAERLGATFIEGDRLHPPENVARMASGQPLTDDYRAGWLDAIGQRIAGENAGGHDAVAACSALKQKYRNRLRQFAPGLVFVHLDIDKETARNRVASRKGHFMPASLIDSQFADLEPPEGDENAVILNATRPVAELVEEAASAIDKVR